MRTQRTLCKHCLEPLRRGRLITDRQLYRRETTDDWRSDEYVDLVAFEFLDISKYGTEFRCLYLNQHHASR